MENKEKLMFVNAKEYERLVRTDMKYWTLINTILNPKNVRLTDTRISDNRLMYSTISDFIMTLVETLEPTKYGNVYAILLEKEARKKEKIDKELEKVSEITKA